MQLSPTATVFLIFLLANVVVFCVYWWDKQAARDRTWRVSERTLLLLALFGGSLGAVAAQQILRHKTRKQPFRIYLMLIVALHVALAGTWLVAPDILAAALTTISS